MTLSCRFGWLRSSPLRTGETNDVKLLVTNGDLEPGTNPDAWKIFKVYVGETGLPLNRPKT